MLKLSIITINFNNLEGLKKTFKSVFEQTYQDFEYIVIDGGSTDGSKEFIEQQQDKLTYWVSEPDKGIYHAMNKGILKAKGEYLNFMNSGDRLYNKDVIFKIFSHNIIDTDIIYGNYLFYNDTKRYKAPSELKFSDFWFKSPICHQTVFIKHTLFQKYGLYETKYKVVADWAFFLLTIIKNNIKYIYSDIDVAEIEYEGLSSSDVGYVKSKKERTEFYRIHFSGYIRDYETLYQYKNLKPYRWAARVYSFYKKFKLK